MPTFEQMQKRFPPKTIGQQIREQSEYGMNKTFTNSPRYRKGMLYDCNMQPLQEFEFKHHKVKKFTLAGDQIEYHAQFRPNVSPEVMFERDDNFFVKVGHRFGFYLDIPNENTGEIEKWLMYGKDAGEFDRYLIIKCNWVFEWIDHEGQYHNCLGVLRDRASYSSGIWSDGTTTTIENQTMFLVPTNDETRTLDYNIRMCISDTIKYPKVYEVSKITDNAPVLGVASVTLKQVHYNPNTDLCGIDLSHKYFYDDKIHMVADFYKTPVTPDKDVEYPEEKFFEMNVHESFKDSNEWVLTGSTEKIYVNGQPVVLQAHRDNVDESCKWYFYVDGSDCSNQINELTDYFDINIDNQKNTFSIKAVNYDMVKYILKIGVGANSNNKYDNFVEMEVCR